LQQNGFTYTLKLLSNVTQDYTSGYFYSYAEQIIQSNVNANEYEYKIPKLDENCVYNIVVVSEQPNAQQMNDIGISKTYRYSMYLFYKILLYILFLKILIIFIFWKKKKKKNRIYSKRFK